MKVQGRHYRTIWLEGHVVRLIDQRLLPHRFAILDCPDAAATCVAIKDMAVRGAGAIGAAAGYAMAQAALAAPAGTFGEALDRARAAIRATRPTAQDLFAAVERVHEAAAQARSAGAAVQAAEAFADQNAQAAQAIGAAGAALLRPGIRVLTHCNAGWLAFVDWGSALAPIYHAHAAGMPLHVFATETRPRSQGAKLTAWELGQAGVPHTLVADTAAGSLFQHGRIDCVIVGADRIAANGDVANKIGTYTLAVLAQRHEIPFYVAAPRSTFDPATPDGQAIPIEQRAAEEVTHVTGLTEQGGWQRVRVAAAGSPAENPAFDVTPAELISRFITEAGVLEPAARAVPR